LMGDFCVSVNKEIKNNQPNLLMNDNDSLKPHSGPTPFCLLQRNKQRNCKDMKKIWSKPKQQISIEAVYAVS